MSSDSESEDLSLESINGIDNVRRAEEMLAAVRLASESRMLSPTYKPPEQTPQGGQAEDH